MKIRLLAAVCLTALSTTSTVRAAVVLTEDFEDATVGYTLRNGATNTVIPEASDGGGDFYGILGIGGISAGGFYQINNIQGSGHFGAMDTDGDTGVDTVVLLWSGLNINGLVDLEFGGLFAEDDDGANQDWDANSSVLVEAQIDGGGFANVFAIAAAGGTNTEPRVDTNFDGTGDGTAITDTLTGFTAQIAGTGNLLDLRITIDNLEAGDEDISFDNITITGVPEPSSIALVAGLMGLGLVRRRRA